ncbi:MAG TPA: P1 family peptidase [Gemmatimonadaceae bacterium]|nr:P1 family peptidase [Gemmatimonadaceae bacterium]
MPSTTTQVDLSPLGLVVGHASDSAGATGVTVVRAPTGALRGAAAVLGRATGTRELDALAPQHVVGRVDAIVLTGGSAYGLGCADGVMRWMEERGRGFAIGGGVVPIVPAAVIFDLGPLGAFSARPTAAMAYAACDDARATPVAEGSVGAGTGATVGKGAGIERAMKGGVGCWVEHAPDAAVGAVAVVNALGDVRDASGRIIAGARADDGRFVDVARALARGELALPAEPAARNTTLAVIGTSAPLSRLALAQLAAAAGAALTRRITPAGTSFDGDAIFAVTPLPERDTDLALAPRRLLQLEVMAAEALEVAVERAVRHAVGREGIPGLADARGGAPA